MMFWIIVVFITLALTHWAWSTYSYARRKAMIIEYLELNRKRRVDDLYGRLAMTSPEEKDE
jgi:hypothetical protein